MALVTASEHLLLLHNSFGITEANCCWNWILYCWYRMAKCFQRISFISGYQLPMNSSIYSLVNHLCHGWLLFMKMQL